MLRCNGHEIMGGGKLVKEQHCLSQALWGGLVWRSLSVATASNHESLRGLRVISSEPAQPSRGLLPSEECPQPRGSSHTQSPALTLFPTPNHPRVFSARFSPCWYLFLLSSPLDPSDPTHKCTFTLFQALKAFSKAQVFLELSTLPNPHKSRHFHLLRLKMNETIWGFKRFALVSGMFM